MQESPVIADRVKDLIAQQLMIDRSLVVESARLFEDLDLDSLDSVELIMAMEEEFNCGVPDGEIAHIKTVEDVIQVVLTRFAPSDSAA
jgi:acyl carrier protein